MHTLKCYSAIKDKILPLVTRTILEGIMITEINQAQKGNAYIFAELISFRVINLHLIVFD